MWQAYVRFRSGSTTRADVAENEDDARKALEDAMSQLKSNGIGTVGPSLVVTKDDLEFIKLEQKQPQDQRERQAATCFPRTRDLRPWGRLAYGRGA